MQRLGRIMVAVSALATLGIIATGLLGYQGADTDQGARVHILVGLGSILVFLLAHFWMLFYLLGSVRVLRQEAQGMGTPLERLDQELARFRTRTLPPLVIAIVLAVGCFVLGAGVYSTGASVLVHAVAFYLVLPAEAWAAWREWRTFGAAERTVRELQAA